MKLIITNDGLAFMNELDLYYIESFVLQDSIITGTLAIDSKPTVDFLKFDKSPN